MKDILIKQLKIDSKNNDIYGLPIKDIDINPPQIITLSPSFTRGNKYHFQIIDSRFDAYDCHLLNITLPPIKGKGKICYSKYAGLKQIVSLEEKCNNISINTTDGLKFMNSYFSPNVYKDDFAVGNREDLCNFRKGNFPDDTIFPQTDLIVPLFKSYDKLPPHSVLRVPKNAKIEFILELTNIKDILIYDREYYENSSSYLDSIAPDIKLTIRAYNIQSPFQIEDRYIEEIYYSHVKDSDYNENPKDEYNSVPFKNITEIGWFCETKQFKNKFFIAYPGYNNDESEFIKCFRNRIFPDLIKISEEHDESFKKNYPENANFVMINNNSEYEFDNLNKCKILIKNIPENHKIWFHTNILEFNRGYKKDHYNISKKFKYILGDYIVEENRIIPIEIIDELTIEDVSIPIDIWEHAFNTAGKDLRSFESRKHDIYINEPHIFGLDFVSKNTGFEKNATVKAGPSERILENNKSNFYFPYFGYTHHRDYYFLEPFRYPCIGNSNFNIVNTLMIKPSSLSSNKEKNILNCSVQVNWTQFSDNHPLKLIPKTLRVFVKKIKKIKYIKDNIEVIE